MTAVDLDNAVAAEQKFVREQLGNGLAAVMVATGRGVRLVQDFTDDRGLLMKTIQTPPGDTAASDTATQFDNLRKAADMLAVLPQKKALMYFVAGTGRTGGDGFPVQAVDCGRGFHCGNR